MAKTENGRRKLKPVIEKKRRDRINQNLAVLRDLLFNSTADTRLQNPKLEKAEILDLAVQYIRKNTHDKTDKKAGDKCVPCSLSAAHISITRPEYFLHQAPRDLPEENRLYDMIEHVFG
ncbi:hypothetical protein KOW79_007402 [Hemibagrus wyckioides]|uniref:BHLH domain-containing protein n=1 Tax=Hemibagrus wyckioides TaxID=337641 RepID=A0A9D3NUF2_9TELE|nr:hypothetical protein KOW79_007402 [Hemibagrus wyckioides]